MNLCIDVLSLVFSYLSTRDIVIFTLVSAKSYSIIYNLPRLFWSERTTYTDRDWSFKQDETRTMYDTECSISLLIKASYALERYHSVWHLFSVRDVEIIPFLSKNHHITSSILSADNEVLLTNYISCINSANIATYTRKMKPQCFRMLRHYYTKVLVQNKASIKMARLLSFNYIMPRIDFYEGDIVRFLNDAWYDIENTAGDLAFVFNEKWRHGNNISDARSLISHLLKYPCLFNCHPLIQISILLICASDEYIWKQFLSVHGRYTSIYREYYDKLTTSIYNTKKYSWAYIVNHYTQIPVCFRKYNELISSIEPNTFIDIYMWDDYEFGRSYVIKRLEGIISKENIDRLFDQKTPYKRFPFRKRYWL